MFNHVSDNGQIEGSEDVPGRIDYPGDVDWFMFEVPAAGELAVRVTDLGLGMVSRLRLITAEGGEVIFEGDEGSAAADPGYVFKIFKGRPGQAFKAEVSHADPGGTGFYNISVGEPMPDERGFPVYLPLFSR